MKKGSPTLTRTQTNELIEKYLDNGGTISKFLSHGRVEILKRNTETKEMEVVNTFATKESYDNFRNHETSNDLD